MKAAFVNSCDALLHARKGGETFCLACAEFALKDKPVITYAKSPQQGHIAILGKQALYYRGAEDLTALLLAFDPATAPSAKAIYLERFAPGPVMQAFRQRLIEPALKNGIDGAAAGLGLRPWHALRLPLARAGLLGA